MSKRKPTDSTSNQEGGSPFITVVWDDEGNDDKATEKAPTFLVRSETIQRATEILSRHWLGVNYKWMPRKLVFRMEAPYMQAGFKRVTIPTEYWSMVMQTCPQIFARLVPSHSVVRQEPVNPVSSTSSGSDSSAFMPKQPRPRAVAPGEQEIRTRPKNTSSRTRKREPTELYHPYRVQPCNEGSRKDVSIPMRSTRRDTRRQISCKQCTKRGVVCKSNGQGALICTSCIERQLACSLKPADIDTLEKLLRSKARHSCRKSTTVGEMDDDSDTDESHSSTELTQRSTPEGGVASGTEEDEEDELEDEEIL